MTLRRRRGLRVRADHVLGSERRLCRISVASRNLGMSKSTYNGLCRARSRLYRNRFFVLLVVKYQYSVLNTHLATLFDVKEICALCEFLLMRFTFSRFFVVWVLPGLFPR